MAERKYFQPQGKSYFGMIGDAFGRASNRIGNAANDAYDTAGAVYDTTGQVADMAGDYFKKTYSPDNLAKAWEGAKIAASNAADRPGETARDLGRGTMAGLAETGSDISGGFGFFENDFSRGAHESAESWRSGIEDKNSVGAAIADEAAQLAAFGPAFKTVTTAGKIFKPLAKGAMKVANKNKLATGLATGAAVANAYADDVNSEPVTRKIAPGGKKIHIKAPKMPVAAQTPPINKQTTQAPKQTTEVIQPKNGGLTKTNAFDYLDLF